MALPKRNYTTPVIVDQDGNMKKEWYIFFRYYHKGEWIPRKYREGINRIKDRKERRAEIEALRTAREQWLQMGWNPILDPKFTAINAVSKTQFADLKKICLTDALDFSLAKKVLSEKSRHDYKTTVKYICQAALNTGLHSLPAVALRRVHIKMLMDTARNITGKVKKAWSDKAYNKHLDYLSSLLSDLVEWEVIEFNPAYRIRRLEVAETQKFIPLTVEEKNIVREYLYRVNKPFYVFINTLYSTGIRPTEILGIQLRDIDFGNKIIRLQPFSGKTKTKKERTVAIAPALLKNLKELIQGECNADYYVFSEGFKPGEIRVKVRVATALWNDIVRLHLGINKYMYSMKHLGADDLTEAAKKSGIKKDKIEDLVQDNLGHSKRFMTRRYTIKGIQINQDIIRKIAPSF